jgi:thymidylate kinase
MTNARLFCFCGVDGAGKSSIVNELEAHELIPDAVYVRIPKVPDSISEYLRKYFPRKYQDGRDWIKGDFAESVGTSLLYEFLDHYYSTIEPLLEDGGTVICDRYALCFEAYLVGIGYPIDFSELMDSLVVPTEMFYVHVPNDVLLQRYNARGGLQDDENIEVMNRFDMGYRFLLPKRCPNYTFVDNSGGFAETMKFVLDEIQKRLQ